ncbi:MAG TPA: pyridoxine 5'-phosphate synthase [Prolixibacteraceae bacterium]|jgi:pyridoxine 5-phosphate synthase|nr:pyridoxine 5'-phosphate synthase [Prolixibacteraceae bacterium]
MTTLSVNINKIATLRNSRGGNTPNVLEVAINCQKFGAQGITVHPRPDERHIRKQDVFDLRPHINTELNIEGYPSPEFIDLVIAVKAHQVTLVPDDASQLTSDHGWDTIKHHAFLKEVVARFKAAGIRTSIFVDPVAAMINGAKETGTNRIELYTESFAKLYPVDPLRAVAPFKESALLAHQLGLGINAGHDLNMKNLRFFSDHVPFLDEVSIGHALIADALYLGLKNTIQEYLSCLK